MKRARPQGLGSNTAKKEKAEKEPAIAVEADAETSKGDGKLFYELPEDATALDQLRALFESATMYLGNLKTTI